jgi:hypothetical protein
MMFTFQTFSDLELCCAVNNESLLSAVPAVLALLQNYIKPDRVPGLWHEVV